LPLSFLGLELLRLRFLACSGRQGGHV
jgi:hypothetical protein